MKLYKKIYDDLKEQILSGKYGNDTLLPTEKELQEKYNVSRITAKHAYRLLELNLGETAEPVISAKGEDIQIPAIFTS